MSLCHTKCDFVSGQNENGKMKMGRREGRKEERKRKCLLYSSFFSQGMLWLPALGSSPPGCCVPVLQKHSLEQAPAVWLTQSAERLHGLRSLHGASPAEPCLDKWQMLPAWNGVLLLTVLNFLQNWPVRGSGSSFLAHLSSSDSFCSGIINRVLSFSFPFQLHMPRTFISRGPLRLCDF